MPEIVTDYAITYPWKAYKNGHNTFTITLLENGAAFNTSDYTFILNVRTPFGEINRLQLTEGAGITNGGATGVITIELTQAQASTTLPRDYYFWELSYEYAGLTYRMFSGGLTLSVDVNTSTSVAISREISIIGTPVSASITLAGNAVTSDSIATALAYTPANDSAVVHKTGDETVAGVKTFSSSPIVPTVATSDDSTKAASTAYVKAVAAGISGSITAEESANIDKLQYSFDNPLFSDKLWEAYESDAITLDATDTDAVMSMIDKAGGGNAFTAASSTAAPTLNGEAIEFDGVDDVLTHNNPSEIPHSTAGTIMCLVYLNPTPGLYYTVLNIGKTGTTSTRRNYLSLYIDETGRPRFSRGEDATTFSDTVYINEDKLITAGWHIVELSATGSAWKIYLNGIEYEVTVSGTNSGKWIGGLTSPELIDSITMGYRFNQFRPAKLMALYIFDDVLTDAERRAYTGYLKRRYKLDEFIGLKLVSYGDSITASGTWQKYVAERLGLFHVNRGIGGTQVKETSSIAYVDSEGNLLSTGDDGPPSGTLGVDYFQILSSMSNQERIDTIPLDAKIITAFGGANDGQASGSIDDPVDTALDTSFYAAYKTMLNRMYTRCPNALIVLIIPPFHVTSDAVGTFSAGTGYDGMRAAIREIGYMYGYPVIDLKAKAQINANNSALYLSDTVHPNDAGGKKIAAVVAHELNVIKPFL